MCTESEAYSKEEHDVLIHTMHVDHVHLMLVEITLAMLELLVPFGSSGDHDLVPGHENKQNNVGKWQKEDSDMETHTKNKVPFQNGLRQGTRCLLRTDSDKEQSVFCTSGLPWCAPHPIAPPMHY
jgi:hypothetical protein